MMAQRHDHNHGAHRPGPTIHPPVIDLHCHVLAGIDDGPRTIEGSVALVRAAGVHNWHIDCSDRETGRGI